MKTKFLTDKEIQDAIKVEHATMGDFVYLNEAWEYYKSIKGELIGVYKEDQLIGIGRFSVLPDNSGWLECLRVHPDHQGQGAGKLIYDDYVALANKYNCHSMSMYTGATNVVSAALAEKYGLYTNHEYQGYILKDLQNANRYNFKHSSVEIINKIIQDESFKMVAFNRTFYHLNELNMKQFLVEGKIYNDEDSIVVLGNRFEQNKTIHIAYMSGNFEKCINFAKNIAKAQNIDSLTCTIEIENKLNNVLENYGFVKEPFRLITKEWNR